METITLDPHAAWPGGPARHVVLVRRFDEDRPRDTVIELHLIGGTQPAEATRPTNPNGTPMHWEQAIGAAKAVAESEHLSRIYVLDRTAGPREQDILAHGGDHSVHMDTLFDTDEEDGVRGTDMRDRPAGR